MGVQQYLRKASLIVAGDNGEGIDLSALRFSFQVRRGDTQTPNNADVRIYNVSQETANRIQQFKPVPEFTRLVLQAGYEGNFGIIFDGQIKQVRRGRESQMDTYLDLTVADGDSAYNFAVSALSLSAGDTDAQSTIAKLLESMATYGISEGYLPDLPTNTLTRGKVLYGMTRDELRAVAANIQTNWSIQDGKLTMIPLTAYMPGEVPVISKDTGMVGLPEQTQNGIKVRTLLNPNLKIGQKVQLDNQSIQQYKYNLGITQQAQNQYDQSVIKLNEGGFYYVMVAEHSGDTRGNDWYTDLICLSVDSTAVPKSLVNKAATNPYVGQVREFG